MLDKPAFGLPSTEVAPRVTTRCDKEETMTRTVLVGTVVAGFVLAIPLGIAVADPQMMVKAKQAGFPAQNCQYCHSIAMPKKETFKPEDLSERGKWLVAEKTKRNAQDISVDWLKEYKGN
jgi:hypothetical protein